MRTVVGASILAAGLLAACGGGGPDSAGGDRAAGGGLGPLQDTVTVGAKNDWMHSFDAGTYWMENQGDPTNIRYFYVPGPDEHHGRRTVEVSVQVEGSPEDSRAGLIYGLQEQPRRYWAIVTDGQRMIEVYTRDAEGFRMTMGSSVEASSDGVTRIEVEEDGREVTIKGNGRSIGSFSSQGTGSGATGILAFGPGRFGFDGFRLSPEPHVEGPSKASRPSPAAPGDAVTASRELSTGTPGAPAGALQARGSTPRPRQSGQVFQERVVRDSGRNNLPAYTLLVPGGWTVEGGLTPPPPTHGRIPYTGDVWIKAPDGRFVRFVPFMEFGYNDQVQGQPLQSFDGRYFFRQPRSLGQFVSEMVRLDPTQKVRNLRILAEDVLPEATRAARQQAAVHYRRAEETTRNSGYTGQRMVYDRRVIRLETAYELEGRPLEETTFATLASTTVYFPTGAVKAAMWSLDNMYSVGGPPGRDHLNDPLLATVVRSRKVNPDWAYAIDAWFKGQRDIILREGIARAAAARGWQNSRAQASDDVLDISFNGWKSRNAASDLGQAKLVDSIHERTAYVSQPGQNVYLPSFYKNNYTDGQGNYVLHNDANYQINADPAFYQRDWQRMQPAY